MAEVTCVLIFEMRPAYWTMLDTAREISLTHGDDAAIVWAQSALERDFGLFVKRTAEPVRPRLRVIKGGL